MKSEHMGSPSVIVVGAGPSGLALAIELGTRGIRCLVVERNEREGYAPRAKTTHTRTRELLRRWGIAEKLAEASPFGIDYPSNVVFVTRLAGQEIARIEDAMFCAPQKDERYSEHAQWIPQYKLEAVLLEHARSLPTVDIQHGREFVGLAQRGTHIDVTTRRVDTGGVETIAADYLVGADGARSEVRNAIGAKLEGRHGLSRNYNIIFRAPGLSDAHRHGPAIMYWQINAEVPSMIGPMDCDDVWFFMPTGVPRDVTYSAEGAADLIRRATGFDMPFEILSSDEWIASRLLADRYRDGRAFLVGDACHLHPPFGGYGMNMGIADAVDLGWKLAAMIQGWGGTRLLDSYERERRPTHEFVLDEAESNHALVPHNMLRPHLAEQTLQGEEARRNLAAEILENKPAEFRSLGVVLGYCYDDSPVIAAGPEREPWRRSREYHPCARAGCLAPHFWLGDGHSLYDLFGLDFTLLVLGATDTAAITAAQTEADMLGVPLKIVVRDEPRLLQLYKTSLALIRPDQHIAWSGSSWPQGTLAMASGREGEPV